MTEHFCSDLIFFVNRRKVVLNNPDPETTLLEFLRYELGLTGTKYGCGEGGCGACTVMISKIINDKLSHMSVNACLLPLCACHGLHVTTVEGVGDTRTKLHPIKEALAESYGSQCGYCTPGIIMSMYSLISNECQPSQTQLKMALDGNLCRCTGYRPILDSFQKFVKKTDGEKICEKLKCCKQSSVKSNVLHKCETNMNCCKPNSLKSAGLQSFDKDCTEATDSEIMTVLTQCSKDNLEFKSKEVSWYRPVNLKQMIALKSKFPHAKIVTGNTEIGIEMRQKNLTYPVLITTSGVGDMHKVAVTMDSMVIGAAVTLTHLEEFLQQFVDTDNNVKSRGPKAILEMLRWFAGRQIRNMACIGGNIMTASPISDLNPILMALGSQLTFISAEGEQKVKMDENFFVSYRKTSNKADELLLQVEIPFVNQNEYVEAYKQAKRKEDDIAIVNSAFKVTFHATQHNKIENIELCFGGKSVKSIKAHKTMQRLKGRTWTDDIVSDASKWLVEELLLPPGTPGGMEAYRCSLVLAFFYKFYLVVAEQLNFYHHDLPANKIPPSHMSAISDKEDFEQSSVQVFEEVSRGVISDGVGVSVAHKSAHKQTTGEAEYVDDMPMFKDELEMVLVYSSKAHAKIISIDATEALQMEGVVDFICHRDLKHENLLSEEFSDDKIFAVDEVTCQGQIIGAILADTKLHALKASRKVNIQYEELKTIITIAEAIENNSFLVPPRTILKGQPEKAYKDSPLKLEGEIKMGGQEHFYLETQSFLAVPKEDHGMEIFASTQHPDAVQKAAAMVLNVPANRIVVRTKRIGGGFGGKESRLLSISQPLAVATDKHQVPVRCTLNRDDDMLITGGRHPFSSKYKVGISESGEILSLLIDLYSNCGNSKDLSIGVMERAIFNVDNAYFIANVKSTGHCCKTNLPSNTAFRGFGTPQAMFMIENIIHHIANATGISSNKIREINFYKESQLTHYNQLLSNCTIQACWSQLMQQSQYCMLEREVEEFNRSNRYKKRGIAAVPLKYGCAFGPCMMNQAGALVNIYTDGSVLLAHGGTEMGQGLHTKMIQVAAQVLGIPTAKIYTSECNTSHVPNASPTAASMSSDLNGMAIVNACNKLNKRLQPFKEANKSGNWESWIQAANQNQVSLSATGFFKIDDLDYNESKNEGRKWSYFAYGAASSLVEIDCLTGHHKLLQSDLVMDLGKSLNPRIDIGQIEGAFVQGYGLFVLEEMKYTPQGIMLTRGPGTYKIPGFANIPAKFNVTILKNQENPRAVYSSKAVGEPPLLLSVSVILAMKEAIASARSDAGLAGEHFKLDSPATPDRIRMLCSDQFLDLIPVDDYVDQKKPWFADV